MNPAGWTRVRHPPGLFIPGCFTVEIYNWTKQERITISHYPTHRHGSLGSVTLSRHRDVGQIIITFVHRSNIYKKYRIIMVYRKLKYYASRHCFNNNHRLFKDQMHINCRIHSYLRIFYKTEKAFSIISKHVDIYSESSKPFRLTQTNPAGTSRYHITIASIIMANVPWIHVR